MGLRDRFKKGAEEKKSEDIGGLVTENQAAYGTGGLAGNVTGSSPSTLGPAPASGGGSPSGGDKGIGESGGIANLDIFSQETAGDEENSLAKSLPEVDINDLLRECHEIADLLRERDEQRSRQ